MKGPLSDSVKEILSNPKSRNDFGNKLKNASGATKGKAGSTIKIGKNSYSPSYSVKKIA